jgi:hypothetical protein
MLQNTLAIIGHCVNAYAGKTAYHIQHYMNDMLVHSEQMRNTEFDIDILI